MIAFGQSLFSSTVAVLPLFSISSISSSEIIMSPWYCPLNSSARSLSERFFSLSTVLKKMFFFISQPIKSLFSYCFLENLVSLRDQNHQFSLLDLSVRNLSTKSIKYLKQLWLTTVPWWSLHKKWLSKNEPQNGAAIAIYISNSISCADFRKSFNHKHPLINLHNRNSIQSILIRVIFKARVKLFRNRWIC